MAETPSTPFRLSRGIAGTTLGIIGISSIFIYPHLWPSGFIFEHSTASWPSQVVLIAIGFFAAELCWVLFLRFRHNVHLRLELVGHHILGICALGCSYFYGVGQATCSVALVTEVLALSGGWIGLGQLKNKPTWIRTGKRVRFVTIKYFRIPIWTYFFVALQLPLLLNPTGISSDLATSPSAYDMAFCQYVGIVTCIGLILHDWHCLKSLKVSRPNKTESQNSKVTPRAQGL